MAGSRAEQSRELTAGRGWWGSPPALRAFREGAAQAPWRILPC